MNFFDRLVIFTVLMLVIWIYDLFAKEKKPEDEFVKSICILGGIGFVLFGGILFFLLEILFN